MNCFHALTPLNRQVREAGPALPRPLDGQREPACLLALDLCNALNALSWRAIWRLFDKYHLRCNGPPPGHEGVYHPLAVRGGP